MGLDSIVRGAVAIADSVTTSLQHNISHYAWSGATVDAYGLVTSWGTPTLRKGIIEAKRRMVRSAEGIDVLSNHKLTFPRQVDVDTRDKMVMPDGTTGPILAVEGIVDAGNSAGKRYLTEVWIG